MQDKRIWMTIYRFEETFWWNCSQNPCTQKQGSATPGPRATSALWTIFVRPAILNSIDITLHNNWLTVETNLWNRNFCSNPLLTSTRVIYCISIDITLHTLYITSQLILRYIHYTLHLDWYYVALQLTNSGDKSLKSKFLFESTANFYKGYILPSGKYKDIVNNVKLISLFGSTYACEQHFSKMNYTKSHIRTRLRDDHLDDLLLQSSTNISPADNKQKPVSHKIIFYLLHIDLRLGQAVKRRNAPV